MNLFQQKRIDLVENNYCLSMNYSSLVNPSSSLIYFSKLRKASNIVTFVFFALGIGGFVLGLIEEESKVIAVAVSGGIVLIHPVIQVIICGIAKGSSNKFEASIEDFVGIADNNCFILNSYNHVSQNLKSYIEKDFSKKKFYNNFNLYMSVGLILLYGLSLILFKFCKN